MTTVYDLLARIGKRPVLVQKEVPGFIGNRLLVALFREALAIVEQGIATPQDVDAVVTNGFGRRFGVAGPFELWELAGLDLIQKVMARLLPEIDDAHEVSPLLAERVVRGELGVKSGKGFYDWTPESAEALRRRIAAAPFEVARWPNPAGPTPRSPSRWTPRPADHFSATWSMSPTSPSSPIWSRHRRGHRPAPIHPVVFLKLQLILLSANETAAPLTLLLTGAHA